MRSFVASEIETAETEAREYRMSRVIVTSKIRSNFEAMRWERQTQLRAASRPLAHSSRPERRARSVIPLSRSFDLNAITRSVTYLDTVVTPETFDQHLTLLEKSGAKFVSLEQILA
jgi:hypothetical protein